MKLQLEIGSLSFFAFEVIYEDPQIQHWTGLLNSPPEIGDWFLRQKKDNLK